MRSVKHNKASGDDQALTQNFADGQNYYFNLYLLEFQGDFKDWPNLADKDNIAEFCVELFKFLAAAVVFV